MSFSLRLCWTVVIAALMLLAVLGSARAQEQGIILPTHSTSAQFITAYFTPAR